jgi:hypothetical protein
MALSIGPTHHVFYGNLYRRGLWLKHLSAAFAYFGNDGWPAAKKQLDSDFSELLEKLSPSGGFNTNLNRLLDDTPIDSFLHYIAERLETYEGKLLKLFHKHAIRTLQDPDWFTTLSQTSMLWGRELAQEYLISEKTYRPTQPAALFSTIYQLLAGGDFGWRPLLLRRQTERELQYELRRCGHTRGYDKETADLSCHLEAMVFSGLVECFAPNALYRRRTTPEVCIDILDGFQMLNDSL